MFPTEIHRLNLAERRMIALQRQRYSSIRIQRGVEEILDCYGDVRSADTLAPPVEVRAYCDAVEALWAGSGLPEELCDTERVR